MATSKRVVGVSVKRSKRAQRTPTIMNESAFVAPERRNVTGGAALVSIDERLIACMRERVEFVRKVYPDVWDSEWGDGQRDADAICVVHGDLVGYVGAIEYMQGVADVFDQTVLTLIDNLGL